MKEEIKSDEELALGQAWKNIGRENSNKRFDVDMNPGAEWQYLAMLATIKARGVFKGDRTGTGTQDLFGYQLRMGLDEGFPLLTTKKMFTRGIFEELLWIMRGETNIKSLQEKKVHIWNEWADEKGDLGPVYGAQFRDSGGFKPSYVIRNVDATPTGVDQLQNSLDTIRNNPWSRRIIIDSWNPQDLKYMALTPCHCLVQFSVRPDEEDINKPKYLDCQLYQRSADAFLGTPFNFTSYALLTHIMAGLTGLVPGEFIHSFGSVHIYNNHRDQVDEQLSRMPKALPTLNIKTFERAPFMSDDNRPITEWSIDDFLHKCRGAEDFEIIGYEHHPAIKAEVSV